jgi:hypothetical protein
MEAIDRSPPESTVAPARALRRSYFREVRWRWSDVLIALAPIIVNRLRPQLLYGLPQWLRYALYLLTFGWMLVFPLGVARRRLGRWPKLPARRVVLVESLIALPAAVLALTNFILTPLVLVRGRECSASWDVRFRAQRRLFGYAGGAGQRGRESRFADG